MGAAGRSATPINLFGVPQRDLQKFVLSVYEV